jgi:hypothetical protein
LLIAAVSLNQYASRRLLGLGQLVLDSLFPERGIAAGCSLATVWVQVYSLGPLRCWAIVHPQVGLSVFIDDLTGESSDTEPHKLVGCLAAGAAALQDCITHELGCKVALHKSALVASSDIVLQRLKRAFGTFAGVAKSSAPNLGIVFS